MLCLQLHVHSNQTWVLTVTSANVDWLSNAFIVAFRKKMSIYLFPRHLNYVANCLGKVENSSYHVTFTPIIKTSFTWNLTKFNKTQMANARRMSRWLKIFMQCINYRMQIMQRRSKCCLTNCDFYAQMTLSLSAVLVITRHTTVQLPCK